MRIIIRLLAVFGVTLLLAWPAIEVSRVERAEAFAAGTSVQTVLAELGPPSFERRITSGQPAICPAETSRELHFKVSGLLTLLLDDATVLCFDSQDQLRASGSFSGDFAGIWILK